MLSMVSKMVLIKRDKFLTSFIQKCYFSPQNVGRVDVFSTLRYIEVPGINSICIAENVGN